MNKKHALTIGIVIAAAAIAYAVASRSSDTYDIETDPSEKPAGQPMQKVAPAAVQDGEYYVTLKEVVANGEDVTLKMSHVTYFEGEEAQLAAENDDPCLKDDSPNKGACAASLTLAQGYYVRQSGAPDFTVPMTASTKIELAGKAGATLPDLAEYVAAASNRPVFVVTMKDGQVVRIRQVR